MFCPKKAVSSWKTCASADFLFRRNVSDFKLSKPFAAPEADLSRAAQGETPDNDAAAGKSERAGEDWMESDWCMPPSASMSEMEGRKEGNGGGGDEAEEKINKGESVKKGIE